jgi:biotin operon repressor
MDEAFQKIQRYGEERKQALALADDRYERCLDLVPQAQQEGYSTAAIAQAIGVSRQALWAQTVKK